MFSRQASAFESPALRQITIEVQKVNGINLGQGVCQLPVPEYVLEQAHQAALEGINRYTNPRGLASLRITLAKKLGHYNKIEELDPETEIVVTNGATGAFEGVCAALLDPGDEVIIFEPTYPYHVQALRRYGVKVVTIKLHEPDWSFDLDELRNAVTAKTKFILLTTPNNPCGKVFSSDELEQIASVYGGLIVTDETYEYMAFDRPHTSAASLPSLQGRVITMGSYSKTFSITGWRIGYCVAPAKITEVITMAVDAIYACAPAPLQEAVARGIEHFDDAFYEGLRLKYKGKRDRFVAGLRAIGMEPLVPEGAYYLLSRYSSTLDSTAFANQMIARAGVGAVPSSDFVRDQATAPWVRFCLALEDDILDQALERLKKL